MDEAVQTIDVKEIAKLKLEFDEYLMVRLPDSVNQAQIKHFGDVLSQILGPSAKRVLVYTGPIGFTKLSFDEAQKALEPKPPVLKEDF